MTRPNLEEVEIELMRTEIEKNIQQVKWQGKLMLHNKLVIFFLSIESILLAIIAYGLLK